MVTHGSSTATCMLSVTVQQHCVLPWQWAWLDAAQQTPVHTLNKDIWSVGIACYFSAVKQTHAHVSIWHRRCSHLVELLPQVEDGREASGPELPVKLGAGGHRPAQDPQLWDHLWGGGGGYRVDTQSFVAHCNNKYDCHSNARRTIQNFTQGRSFIQALSLIQCAMLLWKG